MTLKLINHRKIQLGAVCLAVLIAACSSGGGDDDSGKVSLDGVAAVGNPIVGGQVEVQCAHGPALTATTGEGGLWSISSNNTELPCVIEVSGGKLGSVSGANNTAILHSFALSAGTTNVTSFTTLQLALLAGQEPGLWFDGLKSGSSSLALITDDGANAAWNRLKSILAALPVPITLSPGFNPVTTKFSAISSDSADQALEKLKLNLSTLGVSFADAVVQVAGSADTIEKTPTNMTLASIASFGSGVEAASEIPAYDPESKRLFVVNGALGSIEVWNIANPSSPVQIDTIESSDFGTGLGAVNSVAIKNGIVALAIEANPKTNTGKVVFVQASTLSRISEVTVGAQPDMVAFSPDGRYVLSANEGEPDSYNNALGKPSIDPEGSISIIDVSNINAPVERKATFTSFNSQVDTLRAQGVRIFGPNATAAQDIEPEYITVSPDSKTAYVTLQENNAVAVVDIASATVKRIFPLGLKDFSVAGFGLDASDEDGATDTNTGTPQGKIKTQPVRGMYLPDGIASYRIGTQDYFVTANEGDARDWAGFYEEARVGGGTDPNYQRGSNFTPVLGSYTRIINEPLCGLRSPAENTNSSIAPSIPANLTYDSNLGNMIVTKYFNGGMPPLTGQNSSGQCNAFYSFGGRSFSIWNATTGARVYDSGEEFETRTAALANTPGYNFNFNASNSNNTLDSRSPSKGPEPESVVLHRFGMKVYAFIGLERVGGIMVYDVTNPSAGKFVTYVNPRSGTTGPRGPEGIAVIPASKSPSGKPLLAVGNETSGTTSLFEISLTY